MASARSVGGRGGCGRGCPGVQGSELSLGRLGLEDELRRGTFCSIGPRWSLGQRRRRFARWLCSSWCRIYLPNHVSSLANKVSNSSVSTQSSSVLFRVGCQSCAGSASRDHHARLLRASWFHQYPESTSTFHCHRLCHPSQEYALLGATYKLPCTIPACANSWQYSEFGCSASGSGLACRRGSSAMELVDRFWDHLRQLIVWWRSDLGSRVAKTSLIADFKHQNCSFLDFPWAVVDQKLANLCF